VATENEGTLSYQRVGKNDFVIERKTMNKYRVTDINNASYLISADRMRIDTVNNVDTYIIFIGDNEDDPIAILNLSNIIAVIKEID
jgi:hypothetical protein